jgi:hypothetical protein
MSLLNNITSILDILMALTESSLWVIVVAKSMRHSGVALHGHIIASRSKQLAVFMRFVPAQVELCGDDVCPRQAFKGFREDGRGHPVPQRRPTQLCDDSSVFMFISLPSIAADLCPSVSSGP